MNIVGVPQAENGWDLNWLGKDAGYLNGTAFPTWLGNTVLTGHVWNADNTPGAFAGLRKLQPDDLVKIVAWGQVYTYKVTESRNIWPEQSNVLFQHVSDASTITLMTCELFNPFTRGYTFRRIVRTVFVGISKAQ